jgi:group I intron endonuclease
MFIYAMHHPNTYEIRYIGITVKKNPNERFSHHMHMARKGVKTHCYNWVRSIEKNPIFNVIGTANSVKDLKEMEIQLIKTLRENGVELTNQTKGGDGTTGFSRKGCKGHIPSDETKKMIASTLKGRFGGELNPFHGKKHSEKTKHKMSFAHENRIVSSEARLNMSHAQKGRNHSIEAKTKISVSKRKGLIDQNGCIYESVGDAAIMLATSGSYISRLIRQERDYKGFKFSYLN